MLEFCRFRGPCYFQLQNTNTARTPFASFINGLLQTFRKKALPSIMNGQNDVNVTMVSDHPIKSDQRTDVKYVWLFLN